MCFYAFVDYVSQKKGRLVFVNSNAVAFWTFKLGKSNLISILVHLTKLPEQWKSMNVHGQLWLFFSNKNGIDPLYGPSFAKSIELGMLIMCAQLLHPFFFFLFFSITSNFQTIIKNTYFTSMKSRVRYNYFHFNLVYFHVISRKIKCMFCLLKKLRNA